jgi:hypothetical protein
VDRGGSAYRRSGRFGPPPKSTVRRVQRKRRLVFTAKRNVGTTNARDVRNDTGGQSAAQHRNDERRVWRDGCWVENPSPQPKSRVW